MSQRCLLAFLFSFESLCRETSNIWRDFNLWPAVSHLHGSAGTTDPRSHTYKIMYTALKQKLF